MPSPHQLTEPVAVHGEGPIWQPGLGLRWVDMLAGDVLTLHADSTITRTHVGPVASVIRPADNGRSIVARQTDIVSVEADGRTRLIAAIDMAADTRLNEGGCDPHGRFYCGSMHTGAAERRGHLYRLEPDATIITVLDDITVSNGLDWSPDGDRVYYVDSATRRIDQFDYDAATGLSDRRVFIDLGDVPGLPDGLTVDADGCVWVAMWRGSSVRRYSPIGTLEDVVTLPVSQVTACTFGGDGLGDLFITTSRQGVDATDEPTAGAVFRYESDAHGLPVRPWAG